MKPYRSFAQWVLRTQWPFVILFHAFWCYGIFCMVVEPVEELGWAIFLWVFMAAVMVLFWLGNRWYYRTRLLPFMQRQQRK